MKVTVELPDELLADVCQVARTDNQSVAVSKAVLEYVRAEKARDFAMLLRKGEFDYPITNDEVEKLHG